MSEANHPNINAAGLTSVILEAIVRLSRNRARGAVSLTPGVLNLVADFSVEVSEELDRVFGRDIIGKNNERS